jgi:hypothetical protein
MNHIFLLCPEVYSQENKRGSLQENRDGWPGVYENIKNGLSSTRVIRGRGYSDPGVMGRIVEKSCMFWGIRGGWDMVFSVRISDSILFFVLPEKTDMAKGQVT